MVLSPVVRYGDGTLYGATPSRFYGRFSSGLLAAQDAKVRETGLKVSVIDQRINRWELFTGTFVNMYDLYSPVNNEAQVWQLAHFGYRGTSMMVQLDNGDIYRVRLGDPANTSDRQIYDQTITNPLTAGQWSTWAVLYSGTHYSVSVVNEPGGGPIVYHAKSDGIYRNNTKMWEPRASQGKALDFTPIAEQPDAGWVRVIRQYGFGVTETTKPQNKAVNDLYFTVDLVNVTPTWDPVNYTWLRNSIAPILAPDGRFARFQSNSLYHYSLRPDIGNTLWVSFNPDVSTNDPSEPRALRGLGGGGGHNYITNVQIKLLSDGYYYLTYSETHKDNNYISTATEPLLTFWQRSKDLLHWSEPIGTGARGIMPNLIEHSGYVWMSGINEVWRRPMTGVVYDFSNYVPGVTFDIPKDNQVANGQLTVSNPAGINDALIDLSDREVKIEIGIKNTDGLFEFIEFNKWFIKNSIREVEGKVNKINVVFQDLWDRLNVPLRDVMNFVGRTEWTDFGEGLRNKAFNYFFQTDSNPQVTADFRLDTEGISLWTGWKGHNSTLSAKFSGVSGNPSLIMRYGGPHNYIKLEKVGTTLTLYEVFANTPLAIDSASCAADTSPELKLELHWNGYKAWVNGALVLNDTLEGDTVFRNVKPGYVGFAGTAYKVSGVVFKDWEDDIDMEDLIRTALAMGDFHDASVGGANDKAFAITAGPQTDLPTAADLLRNALETEKLQLIWRNDVITIGKFNDPTIVKVIQDRVISTQQDEEAARRINLASVDGNENTWLEFDAVDTRNRDRQINAYFDLPELLTADAVEARAKEEMHRATLGSSPIAKTVLYFDVWRMDAVNLIDHAGNSKSVRVEGISVDIDQSNRPHQRMELDTGTLNPNGTISIFDHQSDADDSPREDPFT